MRGVILAGGTGTRLRPLTNIVNKHLLPVGNYPMIHYAIEKMASLGIEHILLVIGKQSAGLYTEYVGSGQQWGVNISYKIQEQAGGIAEALALAEDFVSPGEKMLVILGDNLFLDDLTDAVNEFERIANGAHVFLKQVPDPKRYGVPVLNKGRIAIIEEKPEQPQSDYCVTGIYMYDSKVFEIIRTIEPSVRGELEITDVNNVYAATGQLTYSILSGWWLDAGTHASLQQAAVLLTGRDQE
ncbi:spore coat protein [Paenibacillus sp. H1-7]|uniref:sugar phosphate nucleotidyltransferase n=1 Tax=Paenibacillus sp. H1-7 TaxID=2282849 RepID=UPI001EF9007C|nr:sugar phosphate nucleotidyltransferase [Paenibacillus sp. H1-7]ULL17949.1 spore coat protein [Paenibacillus sp. H1-7]